jgi:hypothetical protein
MTIDTRVDHRNIGSRRCTATRADGSPCRAWAVRAPHDGCLLRDRDTLAGGTDAGLDSAVRQAFAEPVRIRKRSGREATRAINCQGFWAALTS